MMFLTREDLTPSLSDIAINPILGAILSMYAIASGDKVLVMVVIIFT